MAWDLVRSTGFVALGLLWLSMALGLLITNKLGRAWSGGPTTFDIHQYVSVLALFFGFIHPLLMLAANYTVVQVFVPFGGLDSKVVAVSLGQLSLILLTLIVPSFAVRWIIGNQVWRALHFLTFLVYVAAVAHGLFSGTDSGSPLVAGFYWGSLVTLIGLTIWRIQTTQAANARAALVYASIQRSRIRTAR